MAVAQHLQLRCFIEGIEVPVVSASVSIQPDAPAQCQIQIPATDKAHQFLPRSLVHLFFLDFYDGPGDTIRVSTSSSERVGTADEVADLSNLSLRPAPRFDATDGMSDLALRDTPDFSASGDTGGWSPSGGTSLPEDDAVDAELTGLPACMDTHAAGPTTTGQITGWGAGVGGPGEVGTSSASTGPVEDHSVEDNKWKLFFCGEVIGYQFMKSASQRAIILSCLDLSVYWDTCYQYQVNVSSLHGNTTAQFVGAGTTLFDTFFQSPESTLVDVITRRSVSHPELTGLLSGVVHLLERVGGVYTRAGFRGVNDFFTIAELRYHLIDMLGAAEDDASSQRLFPRRAFNVWARNSAGRLGQIASFREILNLLNGFIFHNTVPCPVARYQAPDSYSTTRREAVSRTHNFRSTAAYNQISGDIATQRQAVVDFSTTTRQVRNRGLSGAMEGLARNILASRTALEPYSRQYDFTAALSNLQTAATELRTAGAAIARFESANHTDVRARYTNILQRNSSHFQQARTALTDTLTALDGGTYTSRDSRERESETTVSKRLYSQIIRPDIFMCAPPRCNILFPELYSQIEMQRMYLREVSRMRLTVSDEIFGPDELLNSVYFAPDVEVLGARVRQGQQSSTEGATLRREAYAQRLMEHELYTGPVPIFERMNEVNMVAVNGQQTDYRGARVPYVMRAANHQFFKNRWSSRSMSVSGKFNPWAVCGFPAVVVDRPMTAEQLTLSGLRGEEFLEQAAQSNYPGVTRDADNELTFSEDWGILDAWDILKHTVPVQYVGLVMGLQHSVTQDSASTSYTFAAARTHRDNDELLGANRIRTSNRQGGTTTVSTTVAALPSDPPLVGQLGPNHGRITEVTALEQSSGSYRLYGTFNSRGPRGYTMSVLVGTSQRADAYGPEVVTLIGSTTEEVEFRAYRVTEDVESYQQEVVDVPLEDFVRPPWMADCWRNDQIGGVYQQFFGIGAITDPIVIDTRLGDTRTASADARAVQARLSDLSLRDTPDFNPVWDAPGVSASGAYTSDENAIRTPPYTPTQDQQVQGNQDPIRVDGRTVQEAEMHISVERAIDLLVRSYSAIKQQAGADIHEFIRAYTWRPVATLTDMLGSRDLTINAETGETQGVEGFHSRAFGNGENGRNLRNLLPPDSEGRPVRRILGISTESSRLEGGQEAQVTSEDRQRNQDALVRLDTRSEKASAVMAYVTELWQSRGQLG